MFNIICLLIVHALLSYESGGRNIDIALSGGSAHFPGLRASARSVIINSRNPKRIVIHVFELQGDSLDEVGFKEFRKWVVDRGASLMKYVFTEDDIAPYQNSHINVKGGRLKSPSNYVRYILADRLPRSTVICMYMDTDIIAIADVAPLFITSENSQEVITAFPRDFNNIRNSSYRLLKHRGIDVAHQLPTFNAGLLFINLEKWRECNVSSQAAKVADINNELNLWPDFGSQPPLLVLLGGNRFTKLDKTLLVNNVAYEKLEDKIRQRAIFLHWNGRQKPWIPCAWYWEKPSCLNWDIWNEYAK